MEQGAETDTGAKNRNKIKKASYFYLICEKTGM